MKIRGLIGLGLLLTSLVYGGGTADRSNRPSSAKEKTAEPAQPENTGDLPAERKEIIQVPDASYQEHPKEDHALGAVPEHLVWVEGGVFQMGNTAGEEDEKPVHEVRIRSFMIGKTEVTQKEYQALMRDNPSRFKGEALPVEQVTWYDAVEYCNKLSQKEGLTPVYSWAEGEIHADATANGYRLPTEAEWEYAAREGKLDTAGGVYPEGADLESLAWYAENSDNKTHEVALKVPNSLGLYDMAGNVWEWCWDWYRGYATGTPALFPDPVRVTRGGSWNSTVQGLRSTYRHGGDPSKGYSDLGFRVLRSAL
ncbi:MAG: formylglycine-generating enzyme family protein [Treponema sp.]|jgi:formylglycine-generating enzyme required for sulfatase activity|nr:formylglycine-generating enzyme family protein [Treponema sp.]